MPRTDKELLAEIRSAMARHGQGVDDLSDDQLRVRAVGLVGDRQDALEVVLRALTAPADADGPETAIRAFNPAGWRRAPSRPPGSGTGAGDAGHRAGPHSASAGPDGAT